MSRSIIPAFSISSPARMKNGIDISGNALTAFIMRVGQEVEVDVARDEARDRARAEREGERHAEHRDAEKDEDDEEAHRA